MPVKKNRLEHEEDLSDWIVPIVQELDADDEEGVTEGAPLIIEDYQTFSKRFSTKVVWDRWEKVPPVDRVPVVLEAYRRSKRKDEAPNITSARGLTVSENMAEELAQMIYSPQSHSPASTRWSSAMAGGASGKIKG